MGKDKLKFHDIVLRIPVLIEKIVAVFLVIGVVYGCFSLITTAFNFSAGDFETYIEDLMTTAFSVIIVIEFIRMLIRHSMNTVIEVLIFAIARGIVAGHEKPLNLLISVIAIAVLFACRKFFFHDFDFEEEI